MEKINFRFKISPIVWGLIIVVLGLLIAGVVLNIMNLIKFWGYDTLDTITYIVTGIMDLALIVATIMFTINSKYVITKEQIKYVVWGNTKKIPLTNVAEIVHFKLTNKLVLRFTDGEYTVVLIDSKNYQRFVEVLRAFNSQIIYQEEIEENKN